MALVIQRTMIMNGMEGDDLVRVLQAVKTKEGSLWDRYFKEAVKSKVYVSAATISKISDNFSSGNLFRSLRKELEVVF